MEDVVTTRVRRLTRAIVYGILITAVVGTIAFLVRVQFDPLTRADVNVINAATDYTRAHDTFREAALAWQELTQPWVLYLLATLVCVWTWRAHNYKSRALWALATMAIGWALSALIKLVVQRARPEVSEPIHISSGYSFPSGHTTNATIAVTTVIVLVWPLLSPRARPVAVFLGALVVTITCADRAFVGAHFPSDVIAGVLLGLGLVGASYAGYQGWSPPLAASSPASTHSTTSANADRTPR